MHHIGRTFFVRHTGVMAGNQIDGRISLPTLLSYLGKSCNQVLIEAGATLVGAFIGAGLADELVLYQAMKILGAQGRNLLELPDYQMMADIPTLKLVDERKVGADTRFTLRLESNPSLANK